MGHLYPLAEDARSALEGAEAAARTRADAERLAPGASVDALETEWITASEDEAVAMLANADQVAGDGFVQRYEDDAGQPVLAVTYWRIVPKETGAQAAPAPKPKTNDPVPSEPPREPEPDHTDDLYFRSGRTKKRRGRKRYVDPRQLDLFTGPDQQGFEHRDPLNPAVIINDEEGDGTTFGD
ncbi:MAG: hypothetical protein AAGJ32_12185 [Pseudomonadota bacterium]